MTLDQWLTYLEKLHPRSIELGLERIQQVAARLPLDFAGKRIITVGGTNGKGSCIALLHHLFTAAGYRTAAYTSPHLLRYNERVCIAGRPVKDDELCGAFAAVEQARGEVPLTYFEFGTLAALLLFSQEPMDYVLLEVGLGGRLDAVNVVDADAAIVTNVALDHMDWLGPTRQTIGREKAGIARAGRPFIYAERDMPASVEETLENTGAVPYHLGSHFDWRQAADGDGSWEWRGSDSAGRRVRLLKLPACRYELDTAAAVLQAFTLLAGEPDRSTVQKALAGAVPAGRFQRIEGPVPVILDVAHNPHAAANLAQRLQHEFPGRSFKFVFAMLKDKDAEGVIEALRGLKGQWFVGGMRDEPRAAPPQMLYNLLLQSGETALQFDSVETAFSTARSQAEAGDVLVVTGSFHTVGPVLEMLAPPVPALEK